MQKRKDELDYARGFCMLSVVFAHIYTCKDSFLIHYIGSFDMPLFFFISGVLFKPPKDLFDAFRRKAYQLLIPYFFWCFFSFLYWVLLERRFRGDTFDLSVFDGFKGIFVASYPTIIYNAVLWFLPVLFLIEIIFMIISGVNISDKVQWILLFIVIVSFSIISCVFYLPEMPWGINRVIKFSVFFFAGYLFQRLDYEKIQNIKKVITIIITLFIQLLLLYLGLEKRWYDIILGVCGSISIVLSFDLFAIFVSKNNKTLMISKALLYFGRNTMLVYILHGPFYRMCLGVMSKLFKYDLAALRESVVFSFIVSVLVIIILLLMTEILNKYAPILLGRKSKKKTINSNVHIPEDV